MTDITELAQREKFEAWFRSSFHPDKTGPYIKDQLFFAWKAAGAELVDALEKAERANGYLREQSAEWERKAISNFEECAEMSARIEELESQRKLAFTASNRWADKFREAEKRIAELESRTVNIKFAPIQVEELGNVRDGKKHPYMFGAGYNSAVIHCESVIQQELDAKGIKWEAE